MEPAIQQFELKQSHSSVGFRSAILFGIAGLIALITGGIIFNSGFYFFAIFFGIIVLGGVFLWKDAKCIIHTSPQKMMVEVTKGGYRVPQTTSDFFWRNLITFTYDDGNDEESPTLLLKWPNYTDLTFYQGQTDALYAYLKNNFPEKEKK